METCNANAGHAKNISTFVFLDFETTNLLDRKCRITEMCLLAVNRVDFTGAGNFPRVTNKLTLCLDPQQPISMTSSNITGLYNDSLENQKTLTDETITLINAFLNHLNKPVCLLAHNGNRFDFPLLVAELKGINQSLDNSILCADTLEAFRSLDGLPAVHTPTSNQNSVKKLLNSSKDCKNTSVKSTNSNANTSTPLKRKGTDDLSTQNDNSPKVSRLANFDKINTSVEKVKKKLTFEYREEKKSTDKVNKETEENGEAVEEFSSSLDDTHYLQALESVEKDLCKETLVLDKSKNFLTESIKKEQVNENNKRLQSPQNNTSAQETSVETCCVANGTGYYIRKSTQESLTQEMKTVPRRDEPRCNIASSPFENTINLKNNLKENEFSSPKKSSSETNFVVTLMPEQYSPLPKESNSSFKRENSHEENKNVSNSSNNKSIRFEISNATNASEVPVTKNKVSNTTQSESLLDVATDKNLSASSDAANISSASTSTDSQITTRSSVNKYDSTAALPTLSSNSTGFQPASVISESANLFVSESEFSSDNVISSNSLPLQTKPITKIVKDIQIGTSTANSSKTKAAYRAGTQNGSPNFQKQSYKLEDIYFRKFGNRPPQSHKAEDDCITLLKVSKFSQDFIEWVDKNAVLLSSIDSPC